jgi:hypothetical protein
MKSMTDNDDPKRGIPYNERLLPRRAKLLKDNEEPI